MIDAKKQLSESRAAHAFRVMNKDRKVLFAVLALAYLTVVIPIAMFTSEMVNSPSLAGESLAPDADLFRELYIAQDVEDEPKDIPEEDSTQSKQIVTVKARRSPNETEIELRRAFKKRKEETWRGAYESTRCLMHRQLPPGQSSEGRRGIGRRAVCVPDNDKKEQIDYEAPQSSGSVDVSLQYRAIYVPVHKGASSVVQDLVKRRMKGRRISDRNLPLYLEKTGLSLSNFFVFTFVREPFSMFESAYRDVSRMATRNISDPFNPPFASIEDKSSNEPRRAIAALENAKSGLVVPPTLYTQLWKVQRCVGKEKKMLDFNFIGHLDSIAEDWRFIEMKLNMTHKSFPKSQQAINRRNARKLTFDRVTRFDSPWSTLTKHVCDYYMADFECFGFNRTLCQTR